MPLHVAAALGVEAADQRATSIENQQAVLTPTKKRSTTGEPNKCTAPNPSRARRRKR